MVYNTGNPSGSSDPRDLSDSSADIDTWATSTTADTHPDRLGTVRKTWRGMENEFDADQVVRASEFEADQDSREAQFVQLMISGGYTGTGADGAIEEYAAGITVSTYKEIIRDGGEFWRAAASTTLPYTTTGAGMPESGAFVNVGDGVLRQDLVQPVATFNRVSDMVNASNLDVGRKCLTLGYYQPGGGGGNDYEIVEAGTGTADDGSFIDLNNGLQAKGLFLNGVYVDQFGAHKNGTSDDTPAFVSASQYCGQVISSGALSQSKATLFLSGGTYRVESGAPGGVAVRRPDAVSFIGAGSGVTWIKHYGSGTAFKPDDSTDFMSSINDQGYTLIDEGGAGECGWHVFKMIRGCSFNDVFIRQFYDNIRTETVWTHELKNCISTNARRSNVRDMGGTGELFINGGRYDVSDDHSIYINSAAAELILNTGASQFSKRSGVRVELARTVILRDGFFEGNCIGSLEDYYLYLNGTGDALSSCVVENSVINDLNDPNRPGLGAIYVNNFDTFVYTERWSRNAVSSVPEIGSNVINAVLNINGADDLTKTTENFNGTDNKSIEITQLARPKQFYGKDMNSGPSVDLATRNTAIFRSGHNSAGVCVGTYGGVAALQSTTGDLHLNPHANDLKLGNSGIKTEGQRLFSSHRLPTTVTSSSVTADQYAGFVNVNTSVGTRVVDLINLPKVAGVSVIVGKASGDLNGLIVRDTGGALVNGVNDFTISSAYQHLTFINNGTDWFVLGV